MDRFGRQSSSSGQYASQNTQSSPQQRSQTSQPGPAYSQPQAPQSNKAFASGGTSQGSQSYGRSQTVQPGPSQPQGQSAQASSSAKPGPQYGAKDTRSLGGQAIQNVAATKLQSGDQRPPSISRRLYIKWSMVSNSGGNPENTETLVLTDPKSNLFVDVRLLKRTLQDARPGNPAQLEPEDIDWAFAGTINNTALGPDKAPYHRQVRFNHWIDSRSLNPEEIVDNAYMYNPNDGSNDEIEVGSMVNPHTGDKQGYEERWSEEEILPAAGSDGRQCIAMTTEQADGTRGCVMVLGQWAQGVMRTGQGTLHIERWYSEPSSRPALSQQGQSNPTGLLSPQPSHAGLFSPPPAHTGLFSPSPSHAELPGDRNEGWALIARVGAPILPSPASFVSKNLTEGTICSVSGMNWTVRAVRKW